ncbi:response regulator [Shewanella carassii]|uniref:Response regulator n=1 Tax=Shewanella carassii TaxID=1987584 RepID=A0ABQ1SZJ7_9GAMM|nr:response regulator [Shewanella carassii]GGE70175.1 response regulator [Shewanella carassii]
MALNSLNVLLVEDDPVFRNIVAAFLSGRGANVVEAEDGEQGLQSFKNHKYDVVVADLSMPRMGGLEMLKAMSRINPAIPSIVISGNQVMADVVEALRIGACDYLVKPVSDLYSIEHAINQCLLTPEHEQCSLNKDLEELSFMELNENLALLEQNAEAAKCVQQQLFPASRIEYPKARLDYSLFKHEQVSPYFIDSAMVGTNHLIMYMAHFHPEDNRAAFASVLMRSFVNQKLKLNRNGISSVVLEPFNMLSYLNDRLVKSGLDLYCDMIYIAIELDSYRAAIAQAGRGLRCYIRNLDGITPLALADSLQLGLLEWGRPATHFRSILPGESLCIITNEPEHRQLLQQDRFLGLTFNPRVPQGGFVQLSL